MDDIQQIDNFLAENKEPTTVPVQPATPTPADIVEEKAREGKPQKATILQRRSLLSEAELENRIATTMRKYPNRIDELELRQKVAEALGDGEDGDISEADYARIVDQLLRQHKESEEQPAAAAPVIAPPPFVASTAEAMTNRTQQAADWIATRATPGGVGFLVAILIFFVWVVVPVAGGKTRLQLLWGVLTGQVEMPQDLPGQNFGDPTQDSGNTNGGINQAKTGAAVGGRGGLVLLDYNPSFDIE